MFEKDCLLPTQRAFAAAVRSSASQQDALAALEGDTARNQELLAVYRGNAVANASKALGMAYPVIEKIVGAEFFGGLCRAFWEEQPSCNGDLNEYGEGFADFLAGFPHAADLPYLPDVARVEWRVNCAQHAEDHSAIAIAMIADVPPDAVADLRFALQPALALLSSSWPVASIWQQHQADYTGEIDVELKNAECIAVHRFGLRVDVVSLTDAEFALWRAAQTGESLAMMLESAFAVDELFEVQAALQAGFMREFVNAMSLTAPQV